MEKIKLKLEYKKLIREGKFDLADELLKKMHKLFNNEEIIKIEKEVFIENNMDKVDNLDNLIEIKGIGKETMKDIKRIYNSEKELIDALKKDSVPLNNKVVKKLLEYYKI